MVDDHARIGRGPHLVERLLAGTGEGLQTQDDSHEIRSPKTGDSARKGAFRENFSGRQRAAHVRVYDRQIRTNPQ